MCPTERHNLCPEKAGSEKNDFPTGVAYVEVTKNWQTLKVLNIFR